MRKKDPKTTLVGTSGKYPQYDRASGHVSIVQVYRHACRSSNVPRRHRSWKRKFARLAGSICFSVSSIWRFSGVAICERSIVNELSADKRIYDVVECRCTLVVQTNLPVGTQVGGTELIENWSLERQILVQTRAFRDFDTQALRRKIPQRPLLFVSTATRVNSSRKWTSLPKRVRETSLNTCTPGPDKVQRAQAGIF